MQTTTVGRVDPRLLPLSTKTSPEGGPIETDSASERVLDSVSTGKARAATRRVTANELPGLDRMPVYDQAGNGCGSASLAMILTYLTEGKTTQADVDKAVRRMNMFTPPQDLIDFARGRGLVAEGYNNGTWTKVKGMVDDGIPVQALIKSDGAINRGVTGFHYVVVTGYNTDEDGHRTVRFRDPNGWDNTVKLSAFERMWNGVGWGFNKYFMAVAPHGTTVAPSNGRGVEATMGTLEGVANITNGVSRVFSPDSFGDVVHGVFQFIGGVFQSLVCGLCALACTLWTTWADDQVEDMPMLNKTFGSLFRTLNRSGTAISQLANGIGEMIERSGRALSELSSGRPSTAAATADEAVSELTEGSKQAIQTAPKRSTTPFSDLINTR